MKTYLTRLWHWLNNAPPPAAWTETQTFYSHGGTITRRVHWDHLFRVLAARGTP